MTKNKKEFRVSFHSWDDHRDNATEFTPVVISDVDTLAYTLTQLIHDNQVHAFDDLLNADFIYPNIISSREQFVSRHKYLDQYEYEMLGYETHWVKPVIDVLFCEHSDKLYALIELIKDHLDFYDVLMAALEKQAGLPSETWLNWDSEKIVKNIQAMNEYGSKLEKKGIQKGSDAKQLAHAVSSLLPSHGHHSENQDSRDPQKTATLCLLQSKLHFLQTLHSKDEALNHHRGLKHYVSHIHFFKHTRTQQKLQAVQQAVLSVDKPFRINHK